MKFRLYDTKSEWTAKSAALETHLGIPTSGTSRYADPKQVTNEENDDYGKWVMPAVTRGRWACEDQFDPANLVEFQPGWFDDNPPE